MTFQGCDDDIKTVLTKPKASCHGIILSIQIPRKSTLKYDPLHRIDIVGGYFRRDIYDIINCPESNRRNKDLHG
jgi:hypothetical protein